MWERDAVGGLRADLVDHCGHDRVHWNCSREENGGGIRALRLWFGRGVWVFDSLGFEVGIAWRCRRKAILGGRKRELLYFLSEEISCFRTNILYIAIEG